MPQTQSDIGLEGDLGGALIRDGQTVSLHDLNKTPLRSRVRLALKRLRGGF